jgi:hypothetical protein
MAKLRALSDAYPGGTTAYMGSNLVYSATMLPDLNSNLDGNDSTDVGGLDYDAVYLGNEIISDLQVNLIRAVIANRDFANENLECFLFADVAKFLVVDGSNYSLGYA